MAWAADGLLCSAKFPPVETLFFSCSAKGTQGPFRQRSLSEFFPPVLAFPLLSFFFNRCFFPGRAFCEVLRTLPTPPTFPPPALRLFSSAGLTFFFFLRCAQFPPVRFFFVSRRHDFFGSRGYPLSLLPLVFPPLVFGCKLFFPLLTPSVSYLPESPFPP